MKYLGIDYGEKRIGLAVSDDNGQLAFPLSILENNKTILDELEKIITARNITALVLGDSLNQKNEPNSIHAYAEKFKKELQEKFKLPIVSEKEFFTSVEARRYQNDGRRVDASAAALILQRYLDKINK